HVNHKKNSDEGVIVVEEDPDVIHFDNSFDLSLATSLNDLDNATLHIYGQSMEVDAPPDIIDLDEDNDIIDDEDALPHDLADSNDEDLVNVDDDDGVDMSADVARGHDGDSGGDDRPPTHHIPIGCEAKAPKNPIWVAGKRAARRPETSDLLLLEASHANPAPDIYQCGHPVAIAKVVQYQQGFPQGNALGYKPRDRDLQRGEHQAATSREHYPGRLGCPDCLLE
nr:hypothetical protein [Tanacetum cinerariifolium]